MKFQDILSSLFFLSLGITFVLLLLLVYHFRSRIIQTEQKMDSMFEVINDIVKEINIMRSVIMSQTQILGTNHQPFVKSEESKNVEEREVYELGRKPNELIVISDSEQDDEDDDTEYSSSSFEDDGSDSDSDSEYDGEKEKEDQIDEVKIVNIQINEDELNDILEDIEEVENDENIDDDLDNYEENNNISNSESNTENIQIFKIDEESSVTLNQETLEKEDANQIHDSQREIYKKMTPQALKALVISKGIATDTSKLKKPDLIKLLLSNE
jgi:hypothetical protein